MALLTKVQAAARLGIHVNTIDRMIQRGVLRAYKIGPKLIRIDEADLDDYLESHLAQPVAVKTKATEPKKRPCRYVPGMDVV